MVRLATFRNALENDFSRKIIGFDAFGKFPREGLSLTFDKDFISAFEDAGGDGLSLAEAEMLLARKGFENISLSQGNVFETLPAYLEKYPATRIAFLHLDMDVKEPTAFALEILYDRVVPGGLVYLTTITRWRGERCCR